MAPMVPAHLSKNDEFSMWVSETSLVVVLIINLTLSKVYKASIYEISPRNMLDLLKWGTVMMTGMTPTLMFAPQNVLWIQNNLLLVGIWGMIASLVTLDMDMKKANAFIFYHQLSPSGDRILFLNSKRVMDLLLPLLNLAFSALNVHYVKDNHSVPFRLSLIFRAVVVVVGSTRAMVAHVLEPKRYGRRLEDQSIVELRIVPDVASSIYDTIFEDMRDSLIRPLSVPLKIEHAEQCGKMSTPVVGSPAQTTSSPNSCLSHVAVAFTHPGIVQSPAAATFSKLPRMPPNVPALESGDSENLAKCMHTGQSGEVQTTAKSSKLVHSPIMTENADTKIARKFPHVTEVKSQYPSPTAKEDMERVMATESILEGSSTTDQPLSLGSLEEMQMKKDFSLRLQVRPARKAKTILFPRHSVSEVCGSYEASHWTGSQSTQNSHAPSRHISDDTSQATVDPDRNISQNNKDEDEDA